MNLKSNDPSLRSWVKNAEATSFPIQNLPFGIFRTEYLPPGAGVAIGSYILDLTYLQENGYLDGLDLPAGIFNQPQLNDFIGLGRSRVRAVRERLSVLLRSDNEELQGDPAHELALIPEEECRMLLPLQIRNYTDFYSSLQHATNVGKLFRDPENALLPNWMHLPVAYHGRASSIVVSGEPVRRPSGQFLLSGNDQPQFGPTRKLDFELEVAFITCTATMVGEPVPIDHAEDHIVGLVLFNDWSARDFQVWEYVPLGPFLAKSFASSISPWIVTLDALEPFRTAGPAKAKEVLPYLRSSAEANFDIDLEVVLVAGGKETVLCRNNFNEMYWNMREQLAHQTSNGCNIQVGDIYASGTVSGSGPVPEGVKGTVGSLLELTRNGREPVKLEDGSQRCFLEDGDEVIMRGVAEHKGVRIGFGSVKTKILPAL